ncbi:transposase [Methylorubrum extorquens DSM 13060]|jgi:transposase|uniref:Transposase n=2 Tax=Methylorubrum extorquens DSM 13060 TaxID=882800 RepID=H1KPB7_METEX|nr:transposase [Methylorubrum extorquens DSM 13060]OAH40736.1 transposase [Methylorubrum populi]
MGSPLSSDLRERVVKAVSEGASRRQAAERFGVSPASAIRWQESFEREGRVAAKPQGGDRRSQHVEAHADLILRLRAERPTLILSELRALLAERGIATSESGLSRFFRRHAVTHKKTRSTPPSSNDRT